MNAQERYEKFVLPDDAHKVTVVKDEKVENAVAITVEREDHTIGNLIRHELHRDREYVQFAGYKVEHPLEHKVKFQVKSSMDRDPVECFKDALERLSDEMSNIEQAIKKKVGVD
ncbi:subunit Rpb11 of DNA-directed RNA polymerase II [Chloropicon roscoffensis]|uniref:Subunit Rpb11 of DNA-directed RNA polymerase II n=1 Tax=Chloropicon roscoffensis TaxID=1461544 RepID=A0AAX4PHI6_9CHLO|mmetsp:Transcript_12038/g.36560  ORF Transcript_12038/g.36560 Transcript_12038/m.36560 type:complete len:114 (-) Transcript_12038:66-407(-)